MVKWITKTFGRALNKIGGALGMDETGSAGLVATLANNIAMFNIMGEMNPKGKLLNVAFAVGQPLFSVIISGLLRGSTQI